MSPAIPAAGNSFLLHFFRGGQMSLKRILPAVIIAGAIFQSASAYDTQGKFGMGINLMGTPVILFSNLKFGITNTFGIEPSVGFHQLKLTLETYDDSYDDSYDDPYDEYSGSSEYYEPVEPEQKIKFNALILSNMFDFRVIRRERSNFLIRVGGGYTRFWMAEDVEEGSEDLSMWGVSAKAGMGIEHFFTDHFSVYAGFTASWNMFESDSFTISPMLTSIGNQIAELSFAWYLQ